MNILHISPDYPFTPLYHQLLTHFSETDEYGHTMYVPLAYGRSFTHKYDFSSSNVDVVYSHDYHNLERLLYHRKRGKICRAIHRQISMKPSDIVHAHFMFSAGGVAYALKQAIGVRYITAVRNADLNFHFKRSRAIREFGLKILEGASRVVFISPAYRDALAEKYVPEAGRQALLAKSIVVPNGVGDFWLKNKHSREPLKNKKAARLIYAGEFSQNKNIEATIGAVSLLRNKGYDIKLTLVGGGVSEPKYAQKLIGLAGQHSHYVDLHDWTSDKQQLQELYRQADIFVMPSFHETFGLVYIEAMTQGLPVLYTHGEGIDGYFKQGQAGYSINPHDVNDIADKIELTLSDYDSISKRCLEAVDNFSWNHIAQYYEKLYGSLDRDEPTGETRWA